MWTIPVLIRNGSELPVRVDAPDLAVRSGGYERVLAAPEGTTEVDYDMNKRFGDSEPMYVAPGTIAPGEPGAWTALIRRSLFTDGAGHFLWPGMAVLTLTIALVVLFVAGQEARRAARYYEKYSPKWRSGIWAVYHVGIVMLLVGLGAALASHPGMGTQRTLRWVSVVLAFVAAFVELILAVRVVWKTRKDTAKGKGAGLDPN